MGKKDRRSDKHSGAKLAIESFGEIPLVEVSGLAVAAWESGTFLVAVGDHGPDVAHAAIDPASPGDELAACQVIDLSTIDAPPGSPRVEQAEAVATDGLRQAVVLIEDPPLLLVLDVPDRRMTHVFALDGGDLAGLGSSWADDPASRGEGVVLMRDGHVLVVKEKKPAGLIEFGPPGSSPLGISELTLHASGEAWPLPAADALGALAWWPADDGLDDLSDAAVGPGGGLYVVSDKSNAIGRLKLPLAAGPGHRAELERSWRLPDSVVKAEGLAFLPDGRAVVAVDQPDRGRNLITLPSVDTWP
jgi:hypothetical protein